MNNRQKEWKKTINVIKDELVIRLRQETQIVAYSLFLEEILLDEILAEIKQEILGG